MLQLSTGMLLPLCHLSSSISPRGTIIMSDKWAAYNDIQGLPEGYQHVTVSHKLHFIDPLSDACTNTIQSLWQKFKEGKRSGMGLYGLCGQLSCTVHVEEAV